MSDVSGRGKKSLIRLVPKICCNAATRGNDNPVRSYPKNCASGCNIRATSLFSPGKPLDFIPAFLLAHKPGLARLVQKLVTRIVGTGFKNLRMKFGSEIDSREHRLSFVTKATLEQLTPHARPGLYLTNTLICEGQELSHAAYFILSGSCELRRHQADGQEEIFDRLNPGDIFGGLEEIRPDDARISAVASSDSVVLRIERKELDALRSSGNGESSNGHTPAGNGHAPSGNGHTPAGNGHVPGGNGHTEADRILQLPTSPARLQRQVVTLAFLSEHVPASIVSHQLARLVRSETGASVVLVRFVSYSEGANVGGAQPNVYLNGEFRMPAQLSSSDTPFDLLTVGVNGDPSPSSIESLFSELRRRFRYVLMEAPANEHQAPWVFELLLRSDLAYLFLEGRTEDVFQLERVIGQARERCRNGARHLKPIACLATGQAIDGFDLLAQRVAAPVHMYVRYCASIGSKEISTRTAPTFETDIRRLAREIGGKLVGLALSSGAAKGFAHIGVIQVLEENGIEVDVIAGSSMGAYVGSLWSFGYDGRELERLARELEGRWALWGLIDPVFPPRQGFLGGFRVKKRLMRSLGTARFADLARPFRVMATNLETLERFVFAGGEVATAVHASIAVPGICVPISIDGETYIDGGIADPLPVDVLREMGVSRIIAVDAIPTPDRIRYALKAERELARQNHEHRRKLFGRGLPLDRQLNFFARGNLFEILMRSIHGAQVRVAEASCRRADLVLRPNICDDRWLDYRNPGKFMALGREVAEQHLAEIKALVEKTEVNHEFQLAHEPLATIA
jgi:NTE family protein